MIRNLKKYFTYENTTDMNLLTLRIENDRDCMETASGKDPMQPSLNLTGNSWFQVSWKVEVQN